jgi:hypothetical protein
MKVSSPIDIGFNSSFDENKIYTVPDFSVPKSVNVAVPDSANFSQYAIYSSGPTLSAEINFEPYLKVKVTKEEILIALREYYPEKFI